MSDYLNYWYNNNNLDRDGISTDMPPQAIPLNKKDNKWKKRTMDSLERIGIQQFRENRRFSDYYRMTRGEVSYTELSELIPQLRELEDLMDDFKVPSTVKHYDLLGTIINYLETIMMGNRDVFYPTNIDEIATNEREREQSRLMIAYFKQEFEKELEKAFLERGVDRRKTDFKSEEEQQQYQQSVQQLEEELTPQEIHKYLTKSWKTVGVEWAENTLKADKQRLRQDKKERECIHNFLHTGRMFMEYFTKGDSYSFRPWHPINTFFSQTVETSNIEEGEYIGRIHFYTPSDFISSKGLHLNSEQKRKIVNPANYTEGTGGSGSFEESRNKNFSQSVALPFENFNDYKFLTSLEDDLGKPLGRRTVYKKDGTEETFDDFLPRYNSSNFSNAKQLASYMRDDLNLRPDMIMVTEAYFRSWKKVGYLTYLTEEGLIMSEIVTEEILKDFLIENDIKQIKNISITELTEKVKNKPNELINTIVWDYVPEIWKGEKARTSTTPLGEDLYYGIEPLPFQIRGGGGESEVFDVKLPVVGIATNNPADRVLPFQSLYNVVMNQQSNLQEKELGAFFIFDIGFLPSDIKEYGDTETSLYNIMNIIKSTSLLGVDGSRSNVDGGSVFNQFAVQDLSLGRQIREKQEQAEYYKNKAFEQVGLTPQAIFGEPVKYQTATGVDQATKATNSQTDYLYDIFNDFKSRCLETHLTVAQYVQSSDPNITIQYTKSDLSQTFIKLYDPKLPLRKFGIMAISDSKSRRELEQMKQYMLSQNTMDTDSLEISQIIGSESMQSLISIAKAERERKALMEQQRHENALKELQSQLEAEQAKDTRNWTMEEISKQRDRENDIRVKYIDALGRAADNNAQPENLKFIQEEKKISLQQEDRQATREDRLRELDAKIEQEKENYKLKESELALKARALELKDKELDIKKYTSEINKN